jgi:ribosomal-protein-alanine N-acetyltransferase
LRHTIFTPRLELRGGNEAIYSIPFDEREALARGLGVEVPADWPVEHYDKECLDYCLAHLANSPGTPAPMRYMILRESNTLIGTFGGGPGKEPGAIVIGYSVLPAYRRRGYASEALTAVIEEAFATEGIDRIIGETYPELAASRGVLEKHGFRFVGDGEGERVIRYVLER